MQNETEHLFWWAFNFKIEIFFVLHEYFQLIIKQLVYEIFCFSEYILEYV